jgi:hypothetical protein
MSARRFEADSRRELFQTDNDGKMMADIRNQLPVGVYVYVVLASCAEWFVHTLFLFQFFSRQTPGPGHTNTKKKIESSWGKKKGVGWVQSFLPTTHELVHLILRLFLDKDKTKAQT